METILFLIVVGIVSSIYGRVKGNQKQSGTKPVAPKSFDNIRALFGEQVSDNQVNRSEKVSIGQKVSQEFNLQDVEKKYQQIKQGSNSSRIGRITSQPIKTPEVEAFSESPDNKTVINGIIWSEILGEPRSKRPYAARKS